MNVIHILKKVPIPRFLKPHAKAICENIYEHLNNIKQHRLATKVARAAHAGERTAKVAFVMYELAFWKNEALFKAMQADARFTPAFWILAPSYIRNEELRKERLNQCLEYAKKNNFQHYDNLTLEELRKTFAPDFIFTVQPYAHNFPFKIQELKKELPCYIPYGYSNMSTGLAYKDKKIRYFYRYYVESAYIQGEARKYMANKARNTRVTGLPMATWLMNTHIERSDTRPCIIWAPHWTVGYDNGRALNLSTFLTIGDAMLDITRKHKDQLTFAFKPHPRLKRELYITPGWGKERTDAYYRTWREGENTRIEDGDYTTLFAQSDAMIHDCGSFILEYLLMDKPCMYMQRQDAQPQWNRSTRQALECYQKGQTVDDIDQFVQDVIAGKDPLAKKRHEFIHSYLLPNNQSPVQNIIEDLLNP